MCSKGRFALKLEADLPITIYKEDNMDKKKQENVDILRIQLKLAFTELTREFKPKKHRRWADEILDFCENELRRLDNVA